MYVHAKVCVIDDWWATIGSDNFNRRSWTHDSELSAVVLDTTGGDHSAYARRLRLTLAAEHLDRALGPDDYPGDISVLEPGRTPETLDDRLLLEVMADCVDPHAMFDAFAVCDRPAGLARRRASGRAAARPPATAPPLPRVAAHASLGRTAVPRHPRPGRAAPGAAPTAGVLTVVVRALSSRTGFNRYGWQSAMPLIGWSDAPCFTAVRAAVLYGTAQRVYDLTTDWCTRRL